MKCDFSSTFVTSLTEYSGSNIVDFIGKLNTESFAKNGKINPTWNENLLD